MGEPGYGHKGFEPKLTTQTNVMPTLHPATRQMLLGVSTATLCTALFKRGLRNPFIQDVRR